MASHLGPDPSRRSQKVESSGLTPETLGVTHSPSLCPGGCRSRREPRMLRGPGPGSRPRGRIQLAAPHGRLQSPGRSTQARPWALGGDWQDCKDTVSSLSDCPFRSPNAGFFSPGFALLPPAFPHTCSFFQTPSASAGHPFTSSSSPAWGICMTFTVESSPTPPLSHPPTAPTSCIPSGGSSWRAPTTGHPVPGSGCSWEKASDPRALKQSLIIQGSPEH